MSSPKGRFSHSPYTSNVLAPEDLTENTSTTYGAIHTPGSTGSQHLTPNFAGFSPSTPPCLTPSGSQHSIIVNRQLPSPSQAPVPTSGKMIPLCPSPSHSAMHSAEMPSFEAPSGPYSPNCPSPNAPYYGRSTPTQGGYSYGGVQYTPPVYSANPKGSINPTDIVPSGLSRNDSSMSLNPSLNHSPMATKHLSPSAPTPLDTEPLLHSTTSSTLDTPVHSPVVQTSLTPDMGSSAGLTPPPPAPAQATEPTTTSRKASNGPVHKLDGKLEFASLPPMEELGQYYVPAPIPSKPAPNTTRFFGQISFEVKARHLMWMVQYMTDGAVTPTTVKIRGRTGCATVYFKDEDDANFVDRFVDRLLFDHSGLWFARSENQQISLKQYLETEAVTLGAVRVPKSALVIRH